MTPFHEFRSIRSELFAHRNFRWIVAGGAVSLLGDQLTLIALPWLILMLTGDPLALGAVLAVESLPRVSFLLVGGALVDRHSPKRILVIIGWVNSGLLGLLAALVLTGTLAPWMIYVFALAIGLTAAFGYPAGNAMLAHILPSNLLRAGSSLVMSFGQVATLLGPAFAGTLIALFHDGRSSGLADSRGLSVAFALDAFSFAFSGWAFGNIRTVADPHLTPDSIPLLNEIAKGLRHFWADRALRTLCIYYACVSFVLHGPILVALPVLSKLQLAGGASSYGFLMAAHGGGMLMGMGVAGAKPHWRLGTLGSMILLADALAGSALAPLGRIGALWQGMVLLAPVGVLDGFIQVAVFTWIQRRIPPLMLGRSMSLIMFIFMGLSPVSAAVTGAILRVIPPQWIFAGSGVILLLIVLAGFGLTNIRTLVETGPEIGLEYDPAARPNVLLPIRKDLDQA